MCCIFSGKLFINQKLKQGGKNMKKRILSIVLALCMLISLTPMAFADAPGGSCGENLTWTLDANGTLTVSGKGEVNWDGAPNPWLDYKSDIKSLVIGEGVTSVSGAAFMGCQNLESVSFPDTLKEIHMSAFSDCTSLKELVIPDSVTSIDIYTFTNCTSLEYVELGSGLPAIGTRSFSGCTNLKTVVMPEEFATVKHTGTSYDGSTVIIEEEKSIWEGAFYGTAIESIIIPKGTTNISNVAFGDCKDLAVVFIPDTVTTIAYDAFKGSGLTDIVYQGTEEQWSKIDIQTWDGEPNAEVNNATMHFGYKYYPYPYSDISGSGYKEYIIAAYEGGIVNGYTDGTFKPNKAITRGEFLTLLYRLTDGSLIPGVEAPIFTDVTASTWCRDAVMWAANWGITTGYDDGSFKYNKTITRGEMATFICRFLNCLFEFDDSVFEPCEYTDSASISANFINSVYFVSNVGLMGGYTNGSFGSRDSANRGMAATVVVRMCELIAENI